MGRDLVTVYAFKQQGLSDAFDGTYFTDTFISKTTRLYQDPHTAQASAPQSNMDKLNTDLQDVTRIMTKNMEDLLWRGDSLDRELHMGG